jgi:hypothetical protein
MAAGRDTARFTRQIRREQHERNRIATQEAEERRTQLEREAGMTPSDLRRAKARERRTSLLVRRGHRVLGVTEAMDRARYEDKMDRGGEDKVVEPEFDFEPEPKEEEIRDVFEPDATLTDFASWQARKKAEEYGLTTEMLADQHRSSVAGFTVADIERIAAELTGEGTA